MDQDDLKRRRRPGAGRIHPATPWRRDAARLKPMRLGPNSGGLRGRAGRWKRDNLAPVLRLGAVLGRNRIMQPWGREFGMKLRQTTRQKFQDLAGETTVVERMARRARNVRLRVFVASGIVMAGMLVALVAVQRNTEHHFGIGSSQGNGEWKQQGKNCSPCHPSPPGICGYKLHQRHSDPRFRPQRIRQVMINPITIESPGPSAPSNRAS